MMVEISGRPSFNVSPMRINQSVGTARMYNPDNMSLGIVGDAVRIYN